MPNCQELDRSAPFLLSLCAITALSLVISVLQGALSVLALLTCRQDKGEISDQNLAEDGDIQVRRLRKRLPYAE